MDRIAIVIRKDGTVPFDEDCHPQVRKAILEHLALCGKEHDPVPDTNHVKLRHWTPGEVLVPKHSGEKAE